MEKSLDGGIPPNAFVLLRSDLNQINFWPAQFQYVCGKSVKLSFIGADNCALDCWIQLDSFDRDMLKPLKLTDFSREDLCPPASHIDRSSEYSDALKELRESIEDESATTWSPDDNFKVK